jgi:hypothetical protein
MAKNLNPNRAKIHRSYTVEEVSALYGIHKNTVRGWIKKGLPVCDDLKPCLILGQGLRVFLQASRKNRKQKCKPAEMYCMRCKSPQLPALNMVDYEALTATTGRLIGICGACEGGINKFISLANLALIGGQLDVSLPKAQKHIGDRDKPLLNSDFKQ